jgi:hypothetical protein
MIEDTSTKIAVHEAVCAERWKETIQDIVHMVLTDMPGQFNPIFTTDVVGTRIVH